MGWKVTNMINKILNFMSEKDKSLNPVSREDRDWMWNRGYM